MKTWLLTRPKLNGSVRDAALNVIRRWEQQSNQVTLLSGEPGGS